MNDNPFDSQKKDQKNQPTSKPEYEVYSREYMPDGNQYNEYSHSYSPSSGVSSGPHKKGGNAGRTVAVIAIALVVALVVGIGGIFVAAKMVFGYYERNMGFSSDPNETTETDQTPDSQKTSVTQPSSPDKEVFFGSEDETKITVSDSTGIATKGEIGSDGLSYADVVALVADSVVEITTSETSRNGMIYESGAGSGIIVNASGIIITNNHVVDGASFITVRLTSGKTYDAVLVAADSISDIAILKITPNENLTVATFGNSDKLIVGEEIMAIGNPLGVLGGTVTNGIISALEREVTIDNEKMILLQHNAAVSPGNSGGALFNMKGELVGVVNAKSSGNGAEGIGFAIPINTVLSVYQDLVSVGYVKGRPDSGLTLETVVKRVGYFYYEYEVCITASRYTDELKRNDIIVSIDGVEPANISEAQSLLADHSIGDVVTVVVSRSDGNHTVKLTIREYTPVQ